MNCSQASREYVTAGKLDQAQVHWYRVALKPVQLVVYICLVLQAAQERRRGALGDKCVSVGCQLQLEEHPGAPVHAPGGQQLAVVVRVPAKLLVDEAGELGHVDRVLLVFTNSTVELHVGTVASEVTTRLEAKQAGLRAVLLRRLVVCAVDASLCLAVLGCVALPTPCGQ